MIRKAKDTSPIELCGILFGSLKGEKAIVDKVVFVENTLRSPTRFQIDPKEFIENMMQAEREGLQLIGFLHSHPSVPYPSGFDVKYMKLWPNTSWVIISTLDYSISAYTFAGERIRKLQVEMG